ncbi:MAG: S8 family serine peptidase [Oscillospiraceae bacterium]|nr:S8 family serine peptidase [Oscillospiraceae bacterium]
MKHSLKQFLSWVLVFCMVLGFIPAVHASGLVWEKVDLPIPAELSHRPVQKDETAERGDAELVRVSIMLEKPSAVEAGYATMGIASNREAVAYRAELLATQKRMEKTISAQALKGRPLNVVWNLTLVGNIISAWVPYGSLDEIAAVPGVRSVALEAQYEPASAARHDSVSPAAYPSSGMIGSGQLWSSGYTGAGSRVAIIDTGIDTDHQSFDNGAYLYALEQNAAARDMDPERYKATLDLMTDQTIAKVLPQLHAYARYSGLTAEDLYLNEKLPFAFNYVDYSLDIVHDNDRQGEHGSHVAGIAAANRYIPSGSGYADARDAVRMLGVAPDAQLVTMKVFGRGNPFDSDYMVAIEDAIMLGCDAVNLSLGTTAPGSPYTDVFGELMEMMQDTDTVVVISAGNAYNWARSSTFGYLYHDDVSFDTVGSPGSYGSAFTVASVENAGAVGTFFTVSGRTCFYQESSGFGSRSFTSLDPGGSGTAYEFVLLDAPGNAGDYLGLDVARKIVFVAGGGLSNADKVNFAVAKGAAAVVICDSDDNVYGPDLTGVYYSNPVAAISRSDTLAIMAASAKVSDIAYTGTMTVYGRTGAGVTGAYTMSDYSSWGVPGSLTLKPEITAPGGNIRSVWGSNPINGGGSTLYETMSGTSMAAPQVAGMTALLAQVIREEGLAEKTGLSPRHLAQSLLMSTAQPLRETASGGNYYSLLHQGAGLARVDLAAQADSFVKVEGQNDYKVKAELGDDPLRDGIYTFDFTITNLEDTEQAYTLGADLFRQDVFAYSSGSEIRLLDTRTTDIDADVTFYSDAMLAAGSREHDLNGDGRTDAADADLLLEFVVGNQPALQGEGDISGDGLVNSYDAHLLLASLSGDTVTVPAKGTVTVSVRMALTDGAKQELDAETPKGTYVQAFVYARSTAEAGTVHSIPVLAFYGDWSEPSMFDRGTLMELVHMTSSTTPYLYQAIGPYGNALGIDYGNGKEYYYGGNPVLDDDTYLPDRNAFNSVDASRLTEQGFTLIRGAGSARIRITNVKTGEVYYQRELGELFPAFYDPASGQWLNAIQYARLDWSGRDAAGAPLREGTEVAVSLTAVPHYYRQSDGSYPYDDLGIGSTMTTTFTIDNTAPEALDIDLSQIDGDKLTVTARDNRHVAAVALLNANGTRKMSVKSPNQTQLGQTVTVELDIADAYGTEFLVAVYDYANNVTTYRVEMDLGTMEREYFTAIDYNTMTYVGVDRAGQTSFLAETGLPVLARAAEYVGGHVFVITTDNSLCVADDENLSVTERICQLDPNRERLITGVNDLAYNHADGRLYVQYYSELNREARPYLATIDMDDGELQDICELPVDVNTMAIDTAGNFYSAGYDSSKLYTYTLEQITGLAPHMTTVGNMGEFYSTHLSSMAWDHNEGRLYWAYPNVLLEIDPKTAEVTVIAEQEATLVGLYTRPEHDEGMFDPVDTVDRVELSHTDTRVVLGNGMDLEATVWPWYVSDRSVRWSSSNDSVARVDENGRVTAVGLGECVITAASVIDPDKRASCTVSTFEHEKTLRAVIRDENGKAWMSEFSTSRIPDYTRLSDKSLGIDLAAATMSQDGWLYASTIYMDSMSSDLYRLDPDTFAATRIGPSADAYVDLAPAPGAPGNSLMAVYGGNVLHVDAETGDYYNWYYMFSNNLVALAYVGTQPYNYGSYDTMVDWYFIIDRLGYVYLMGFLEQDGRYYYLEHDTLAPKGIYTKLDFEMDTPYYGSAYFDGEMLYYSAYKETRDHVVLMAIDVAGGSKACYELGTFADGVWPVAGLMEPGEVRNHIGVIMPDQALSVTSMPVRVEQQEELTGIRETKAQGTLHSAAAPLSSGEIRDELVYVDVTLPAPGTNADMTVSFDGSMLELTAVSGSADAFAWKAAAGQIKLSLADAQMISDTRTVARLTFRPAASGETTVSIVTDYLGAEENGQLQQLPLTLEVQKPHEHSYTAVVTEPSCTEGGYTTYTCSCGESYVADHTDPLGHDFVDGICTRCGEKEETPSVNPFLDVPVDAFYHDPVMWAVENGITKGIDDTHFGPGLACSRAQVVTFLWRAAGSPEPVSHENPFVDVSEGDFCYKAVLWALEAGITKGVDASHFGSGMECTRAHVVTFLYRSMGKPEVSAATSTFDDVADPNVFCYIPVLWAVENGITKGIDANTFGVGQTCSRAQIVTFLYRAMA